MSFVGADDHPDPIGPDDPRYYAPRSERSRVNARSSAGQQTRSDHLPAEPPMSRFDDMREKAFAKSIRPLESQFVTNAARNADCSLLSARSPQRSASPRCWRSFCSTRCQGQKAIPRSSPFRFLLRHRLRRPPKRPPTTPRHCFRGSSSFTEAKTRIRPLPRERRRDPKSPQNCLKNSCSGRTRNSVAQHSGTAVSESRLVTESKNQRRQLA